jgi:hypothetical protein
MFRAGQEKAAGAEGRGRREEQVEASSSEVDLPGDILSETFDA